MAFATLAAGLRAVRDDIARIQAAEGLTRPVRIVAVTKGHPPAAVTAAVEAGLADVGENRVQELLAKQDALAGPAGARWHLVGHLQRNKAKYLPGRVALVHSIDSARVADALADAVERQQAEPMAVLVQVNVAGETQKAGCALEEAPALVAHVAARSKLVLQGLMTMAPFTDDEAAQRRVFGALRRLRDDLATPAQPLPELSMGMTGDYRAAVAEGATLVRLGTVLFGERAEP